jgi:F-type H+-transporting ATPase subunit epsilon
MADVVHLEVATPERELVTADVAEVQIPGKSGYLGILPGHAPLLSELGTGFLSYSAGTRRWFVALQGGFLEVRDDHVRVLATSAERAEEVDVERAREALKEAEEQLINPALGVDPAVALEAIAWSQARIAAAEQK